MKKYLFAFLFAFFFITLVSAQPPAVFGPETIGYELVSIEPPANIAQNTTYYLHIHVLNKSNSHLVNTSLTCFYHLENPTGMKITEGFLTLTTSSVTANLSYSATILGNNFSTNGLYNVLMECFDGGMRAGITRGIIEVSRQGYILTTAQMILYVLIELIILIFVIFTLYFGIIIPYDNPKGERGVVKVNWFKYLKIFCWFMFYLFVWVFVFIVWNLLWAYSDWNNLATFFKYLFYLWGSLGLPLLIGTTIIIVTNFFADRKISNYIERFGGEYNG